MRAAVFNSVSCGRCLACVKDFSLVFLDYGLLVVCAAITNIYVVFVENLAVSVIQGSETADVCLYVYAVGWIKPDYISLSVLVAILCVVSCWFLAFGVG